MNKLIKQCEEAIENGTFHTPISKQLDDFRDRVKEEIGQIEEMLSFVKDERAFIFGVLYEDKTLEEMKEEKLHELNEYAQLRMVCEEDMTEEVHSRITALFNGEKHPNRRDR